MENDKVLIASFDDEPHAEAAATSEQLGFSKATWG